MTISILTIGINATLLDELVANHPKEVINAKSCREAVDIIPEKDITTIIFDTKASKSIESDVDCLLSATPITTNLVLITPTTNLVENQHFTGLGISTLTGPISSKDLMPFLP